MVKFCPEYVTAPEQGKSSGRIVTFSLWTGMFRDGISCIPGKQLYRCDSVVIASFVRTGYTTRRWGWLLDRSIKGRDSRRITAAGMKYMRRTAGYTWTDYKTNAQFGKHLKITPILDKLLEYKRSWIQHVNRMPRNRLPRVMKHYCPTGRRNRGRRLKRLLGTWDRNGSTGGTTAWQIYGDDDDYDDDDD